MGSLPGDHVGVGSAANGAFLQVGGALGGAIIGSLLNTRYQDTMSAALVKTAFVSGMDLGLEVGAAVPWPAW